MPPTTPTTTVGRKSSGRATPPKAKPERPDAPPTAMVGLDGEGPYPITAGAWTARVVARCRREIGCVPAEIFEEIQGIRGGRADIDTAVRLFCLAAWMNGGEADYESLLDTTTASTQFILREDPAGDDSPEA